jgi:hypothetical protein
VLQTEKDQQEKIEDPGNSPRIRRCFFNQAEPAKPEAEDKNTLPGQAEKKATKGHGTASR